MYSYRPLIFFFFFAFHIRSFCLSLSRVNCDTVKSWRCALLTNYGSVQLNRSQQEFRSFRPGTYVFSELRKLFNGTRLAWVIQRVSCVKNRAKLILNSHVFKWIDHFLSYDIYQLKVTQFLSSREVKSVFFGISELMQIAHLHFITSPAVEVSFIIEF